ncbi:MAG: hypothetical protein AAF408_08645 [Pseudomonadota bacterium]
MSSVKLPKKATRCSNALRFENAFAAHFKSNRLLVMPKKPCLGIHGTVSFALLSEEILVEFGLIRPKKLEQKTNKRYHSKKVEKSWEIMGIGSDPLKIHYIVSLSGLLSIYSVFRVIFSKNSLTTFLSRALSAVFFD